MVIELAVLRREHRPLYVQGHIGQGDAATSGVAQTPDLGGAVGVVDDRRLRARDLIGIGHGGQVDGGRERSGPQ